MRSIEINVNGESYPCSPTMGAMVRFREATGREVTTIQSDSITDMCRYLWCCIVSACKREGKEFGMSFIDFADAITTEDLIVWSNMIGSDETDVDSKKKN